MVSLRISALLSCLVLFLSASHAVAGPVRSAMGGAAAPSVAALYEAVRGDPLRLELFMRSFPKGADLHNHLSGAVYAESFLKWAAQDGLCVSLEKKTILPTVCPRSGDGQVMAKDLADNAGSWNAMVDALSMRNFVPTGDDRSGHDHFFATFLRFTAAERLHQGDMLAEARERAAHDHVQYLELQIAPVPFSSLAGIMKAASVPPLRDAADMDKAYKALRPALGHMAELSRAAIDGMEARARQVMQCGTSRARAGCRVMVRYQYSALRVFPSAFVWTQLVAAYEAARQDSRLVGINIVAPEDDPVALRDYDLHMQMFHYLNQRYPGTKLSLHAGEVTPALVPLADLDHHIRAAIDVAGARRIGHGVDVLRERDPAGLLREMAQKHVLVEINLTSNDEILGVRGAHHPFPLYRRAGVPVALSTDDEGVSRSDLTRDYMRAATDYHLDYPALIQLSRSGLEYGFMPGASLWMRHEPGHVVPVCAHITLGKAGPLPAGCARLLSDSLKARLQWQLERAFRTFENDVTHNPLLVSSFE